MRAPRRNTGFVAVIAVVTVAATATAQDEPAPTVDPVDSDAAWRVELGPYVFLPWADGDVTVAGINVDLDLSLDTIIDDLDFLASGRLEAWYDDRLGIIFDGLYENLGTRGTFVQNESFTVALEFELSFGPRRLREIDITIEEEFDFEFEEAVDIDFKYTVIDLALGWRLFDGPVGTGDGSPQRLFVDVIGGLRYQELEIETRVRGCSARWPSFTALRHAVALVPVYVIGRLAAFWTMQSLLSMVV